MHKILLAVGVVVALITLTGCNNKPADTSHLLTGLRVAAAQPLPPDPTLLQSCVRDLVAFGATETKVQKADVVVSITVFDGENEVKATSSQTHRLLFWEAVYDRAEARDDLLSFAQKVSPLLKTNRQTDSPSPPS